MLQSGANDQDTQVIKTVWVDIDHYNAFIFCYFEQMSPQSDPLCHYPLTTYVKVLSTANLTGETYIFILVHTFLRSIPLYMTCCGSLYENMVDASINLSFSALSSSVSVPSRETGQGSKGAVFESPVVWPALSFTVSFPSRGTWQKSAGVVIEFIVLWYDAPVSATCSEVEYKPRGVDINFLFIY